MFKGIDVSQHNGSINWENVKKSGIQFAMIRAGYGKNTMDNHFIYNITECNRLGIPCGVYWFSYALNESMAENEARYCLNAVKPYKLEYPIAYDFEYDSVDYAKKQGITISKAMASSFAKAFLSTIEKAKYCAINYSNLDYLSRYYNDEVKNSYSLWLAAWNKNENPPRTCAMWQNGVGRVNGVSGDVDTDKSYVDFPAYIKANGLNGFVNKEEWYSDARKWVVANGISDGTDPDGNATRAMVWTMLYRYDQGKG